MTVPPSVEHLVDLFKRNKDVYLSPFYKEMQLRNEFIDPLFAALEWDVYNRHGTHPIYREVIIEDRLRMRSAATSEAEIRVRAPDYGFYLQGVRKFFVETKKPFANLQTAIDPAYQLRSYAWSAQLPLSILTDFQEFGIYDGRVKPNRADPPKLARYRYIGFEDYLTEWDTIANLFHRESVQAGSLERYAANEKPERTPIIVDTAFLRDIEVWRSLLAEELAARNPQLNWRDLNYAVQTTLDRIIFLRICEDRGIEEYGRLQQATSGSNVYTQLCRLFQLADDRYNSGLFHFRPEKDRAESPDDLTLTLAFGDDPLRRILTQLYPPESPYAFGVIPSEILGQVYERFLGKTIRLDTHHRAVVEEKPEVRKAGGVYYTPTYIVEALVARILEPLLKDKTPDQVAQLRILDLACGSGSFLLNAYQYLLLWHLEWYVRNGARKYIQKVYIRDDGTPRLTTAERKRILLNNIYGVDIDRQAVGVTKLSLALEVLDGETDETVSQQRTLFHERALPDLGRNIKCGNSLVGSEFYDRQLSFLDEDTRYQINLFDWDQEFKAILGTDEDDPATRGFDVLVGNPPYVRSITLKESNPQEWAFCRTHYRSAADREWDLYLVFVEKALSLLKPTGKLGFILPNKFLNSQVGANLRTLLASGQHLARLVHFGAFQIFSGATTYTCLLFLDGARVQHAEIDRYTGPVSKAGARCPLPDEMPHLWTHSNIPTATLTGGAWEFSTSARGVLERLRHWPGLGQVAHVFQGTGTRADKVYLLEDRGREGDLVRVYSPERDAEYLLEPTFLKPALRGRSIGRYAIEDRHLLLLVPYTNSTGRYTLVSQVQLATETPHTFAYLQTCKPRLDEREGGRFVGEGWYCYGRPQNLDRFDGPAKIVLPDIGNRGTCWLDQEGHWLLDTAYAIMPRSEATVDLRYLLAILNSPLLTYFLKETGTALRGGYFRMKTAYLNPFPVRPINGADSRDRARHDQVVTLVEHLLALRVEQARVRTNEDKQALTRQIGALDQQLNRLVYELYELTPSEIAVVEGVG